MAKKLSIGTWAYAFGPYANNPVPFDTVVRTLGKLGFDGVEIGAFRPHIHPDDYPMCCDRTKVRNLCKVNELEVSGVAVDFWFAPPPGSDESLKGDSYVNLFKKNLQLTLDLGGPSIRVDTVAGPEEGPKGVDRKTAIKRIVELWRQCSSIAESHGVKVIWEFEPGFFLNKPSEVLQLVNDVNHPNFSVLFDTCHAYMCAVSGARQAGTKETLKGGVAEFARLLKGKIGHLHVIDCDGSLNEHGTSTHNPFGEGKINFDEALSAAVHDAGYKGDWFTIDLCFWPEAWQVTERAQKFLAPYLAKY